MVKKKTEVPKKVPKKTAEGGKMFLLFDTDFVTTAKEKVTPKKVKKGSTSSAKGEEVKTKKAAKKPVDKAAKSPAAKKSAKGSAAKTGKSPAKPTKKVGKSPAAKKAAAKKATAKSPVAKKAAKKVWPEHTVLYYTAQGRALKDRPVLCSDNDHQAYCIRHLTVRSGRVVCGICAF